MISSPIRLGERCAPGHQRPDETEAGLLIDAARRVAIRPKGAGQGALAAMGDERMGQCAPQAASAMRRGHQQVIDAADAVVIGMAVDRADGLLVHIGGEKEISS